MIHRGDRFAPVFVAAAVFLSGATARAEGFGAASTTRLGAPVRSYANFRLGASSTTGSGRPSMCLELGPLAWLSVDACGTGSGFLHHEDSPEVAHFLAKVRVAKLRARGAILEPHLNVGFAELQVGEDSPGFDFRGTGPDEVETAGAEFGTSLRLLSPLGRRLEMVGELSVSLAYLPHAPELARPQDAWQPMAAVSAGVGF